MFHTYFWVKKKYLNNVHLEYSQSKNEKPKSKPKNFEILIQHHHMTIIEYLSNIATVLDYCLVWFGLLYIVMSSDEIRGAVVFFLVGAEREYIEFQPNQPVFETPRGAAVLWIIFSGPVLGCFLGIIILRVAGLLGLAE